MSQELYSIHRNPEEVCSNTDKRMPQQQNDDLASKSEGEK